MSGVDGILKSTHAMPRTKPLNANANNPFDHLSIQYVKKLALPIILRASDPGTKKKKKKNPPQVPNNTRGKPSRIAHANVSISAASDSAFMLFHMLSLSTEALASSSCLSSAELSLQ